MFFPRTHIYSVFVSNPKINLSKCPTITNKKFNRHSQKVLKLIDLKMSKSEPQKKAPIILNPKSSKQP